MVSTSSIQKTKSVKRPLKRKKETRFGSGYALQDGNKKALQGATGNCSEWRHSPHKKTRYARIVEAHESKSKRLESTFPRNHDDHIAEKWFNSLCHCNLVHKFARMPHAIKIRVRELEWIKNGRSSRKSLLGRWIR